MSLRTPRRKISPRARRRYRAIRNFFKRTLSSLTSLSAIKVNSSSGEIVPDSNRAHMGHQMHARQNRPNPASVGNLFRSHTEDLRPTKMHNSPKRRRRFSERNFEDETKVLYKPSTNMCTNSYDCGLKLNELSDTERHSSDRIKQEPCTSSHHISRRRPRTEYDTCQDFNGNRSGFRKPSAQRSVENSTYSGSFESLALPSHRGPRLSSPGCIRQQENAQPDQKKIKRRRERPKRYKSKSPHFQNEARRKKREQPANQEHQFIADIINKQYKPLSFFGRRASDISQISTPVCRDQRFSAREIVIPESDVSSLCEAHPAQCCRYARAEGVQRLPSECKTRHDSSPRLPRQRRRRADNYNDSNFYDVVPVKEKTSPKSRRKFIEDHMELNEIPPSPRTQRPRLILETQNYSDYEDYEQPKTQMRRKSPHRRPEYQLIHSVGNDMSTEESPRNGVKISPKFAKRLYNVYKLQDEAVTPTSSQQCFTSPNTTNNTLNNSKAQEQDDTMVTDKTDKALSEIKDILQSFLQELKKDSSTSHSEQASGTSKKNSTKHADGSLQGSVNGTSNALKNNNESSFNCGVGQNSMPTMQPQFIPQHFANPYCYPPMIPVYGTHGVPYLVASPSCVCTSAGCGHNHTPPRTTTAHDIQCRTCSKVNCTETQPPKTSCETDILIKEIYNYVAGNLNGLKKEASKTSQDHFDGSVRQKPSVGKSMHSLHRDANVGTHPLRCYSKSCEAIVSRQLFDSYYATYPSYSDSLIEERVSREAFMDYQMPRETNEYSFPNKRKPTNIPKQQQSQDSKFVSALKLLKKNSKKNRKDVREVCLSEQSIEVDVIPKTGHNFKQEYATYSMHGQEFIRPPPLRHDPRYPPSYDYDYSYDPRRPRCPSTVAVNDVYSHYDHMSHPTAPMYDNPYEQCGPMQPQVPLCFKEVEVRSIGIQSQKKTQFRLFPQKKESLESKESRPLVSILRDVRRKISNTDVFEDTKQEKQEKPRKFFNLNSQAAASKSEPMPSWTDRIQKDITKNDKMVSNAMLKKMFHKRNPFSPQNRFMRTIMEKDTPVFKWRPRLFI